MNVIPSIHLKYSSTCDGVSMLASTKNDLFSLAPTIILALLMTSLVACGGGAASTASPVSQVPVVMPVKDPVQVNVLPMLRASGTQWVQEDGKQILLRGTNLGNWLVQEFWMMGQGSNGVTDQCTLENKLTDRFSYAEKERLMKLYHDSWITSRDWDQMRSFGLNVVRVPFLWSVIEDEKKPMNLRANAWEYLDKSINEAEQRGMYVILDLHGAVGGQGTADHTGCAGQNKYWSTPEYISRTKWLWEQIARRYKDRNAVAAYGLLNEPWGSTDTDMGKRATELYNAVRAIDSKHIVLLPGYYSGIDAYGNPAEKGMTNVAFEMHFYPGIFDGRKMEYAVHRDWLRCGASGVEGVCDWDVRIKKLNVPFLIGEFQTWQSMGLDFGGKVTRATYDTYAGYGWASTNWAYKWLSKTGGQGSGTWGMVTNAANPSNGIVTLDFASASMTEIEALFKSFATVSYDVHSGLSQWLTAATPPSIFNLPARPVGLQLISSQNSNTNANAGANVLTWNVSADANVIGYRVYRSTSPHVLNNASSSNSTQNLIADGVKVTTFTDMDLAADANYYYAVSALTISDESYVSEEVKTPYKAKTIPATLQAEDYAAMLGVQIENTNDMGGGFNVGYLDAGDWLEYRIKVTTAGNYVVDYRLASQVGSAGFDLLIDGVKMDTQAVPNTGAWQNWVTVTGTTIPLSVGEHIVRVNVKGGSWNINWLRFTTKNL
jgi:endoglucanase